MALALSCSLPIAAQAPVRASTFLPVVHWSGDALRRLAGAGLIDLHAATLTRPRSREHTAAWLDHARKQAQTNSNPELVEISESYYLLFDREQPVSSARPFSGLHTAVSAGFVFRENELRAGITVPAATGYVYPGPASLPDQSNFLLELEAWAHATPWLALGANTKLQDHEVSFAPYLSTRVGGVDLWLGRRGFISGSVPRESVVLGQPNEFDGGAISAANGIRVPWIGLVFPELLLARLDRSGPVRHPFFHAARITIAPRPHVVIGLNRASIFGGEDQIPVTPARVLLMLLGFTDTTIKDSDFENQVASIDFLWRVRSGQTPLLVYAEYGSDDAGAFLHVPAVMLGVEVLATPILSLGLEALRIQRRCCQFPPWYRHGALPEGWSSGGKLLGHSLAGAGNQVALSMDLVLPSSAVVVNAQWYAREREAENLLAPDRDGFSTGGSLELVVPWRQLQLRGQGELERGSDWTRARGSIRVTAFF